MLLQEAQEQKDVELAELKREQDRLAAAAAAREKAKADREAEREAELDQLRESAARVS